MFRPFNPEDGEQTRAEIEAAMPSLVETLPTLVICALIGAAIKWPHAAAMFVGKILNGLAAIAGILHAVATS